VQWRTGFEIGVTFENDEAPSIVPSAGPADLLERVRRLEAEVASLHRKLNELQNELRHGQGSGI
jgi:ubiquinone biosynthesis protein UbiJ